MCIDASNNFLIVPTHHQYIICTVLEEWPKCDDDHSDDHDDSGGLSSSIGLTFVAAAAIAVAAAI
tara:strand:+ start:757 stop:951 length:195 start_codon:yes stop_codon:yes gene_type:complete